MEPVVVVNVAEVASAGTVTDAGTGRAAVLLDASVTTLPPLGAAWFRATVHVVALPETTLTGAQTTDDTRGLGVTVTVTDAGTGRAPVLLDASVTMLPPVGAA